MPPAAILGAAVVGGVASYATSKSATKAATKASNYAADQNAAVNREIYNQTRADLAPYNQAGQAGLAALMQRLGLSGGATTQTPGGAAGTSPVVPAAASGGVNYDQLFQDRPDVRAEYERVAAQADPNSPQYQKLGLDRGAEGFADYWLANKPAADTYAAPTIAAQPTTPDPTQAGTPTLTPQDEAAQFGTRPDALAVPTYSRPTDLSAPAAFSYTPADIENDAGYKFARDQALGGVNASFAARGAVRSGGALKALQDRAAGVAHQWDSDYFNRALQTYNTNTDAYRYAQGRADQNFLDDRSYGTNLWNTQQQRNDNIFSEDRGFTAGRYDQNTSNLFGLVGVGQNAAAGSASAGNVFANNTIANNNQRAATTANAAIANAQNTTNLFGSALNAAGTYYGMRGGSGSSLPRTYSI